jgi:hydroxymethylbilane synthase
MSKTIRIGTRDSALALWQAKTVQQQLKALNFKTELIPIKSEGDLNLNQPLYEMGITGIFTKSLDIALLNNKIDIAVHSMKDVPTSLPKGIIESAVLKRHSNKDILVYNNLEFLEKPNETIGTGSLRRRAQWLNKYPLHITEDLRGNVLTRLSKLEKNRWGGAIFALAGLERINALPKNHIVLDWMIPAPAQGAMLIVTKKEDVFSYNATHHLNHNETEICIQIERAFLKTLEGGCTAPIGASAKIKNNHIVFKGVLLALDGSRKIEINESVDFNSYSGFGEKCANHILENGGKELMTEIKQNLS